MERRSAAAHGGPPLVALAAGALAATLGMLHAHATSRALDPIGVVLAALTALPLLGARRAPLAVFVLTAAASAALKVIGYHLTVPIGATFALVLLASHPRTRDRLPVTAITVLGMLALYLGAAALGPDHAASGPTWGAIALWGGAWIAGEQVRHRRQRGADFRQRAEQARREREREQQLAVAEERNRIARDLHDSAAHAINVILVQAGAARLLQERDPEATRKALTTIEDVARETIDDIDNMIRGLRERSGAVEAPTGLAAARTLVERHRSSGLETEMHTEGDPRPLSRGVDQAAYRILQESLTNAARYGDGRAEVRIGYGGTRLELTVSNAISERAEKGVGGHGIVGMRERAELLGGTLAADQDGDRFVVRATLPY